MSAGTRTLKKDTIRLIRTTRSRFLLLTAVVAIGMGFFVGLTSSSLFMGHSVDLYDDQENLKDLTIYSNVGFDEADVEAVEQVDGVETAEGGMFVDVMVNDGSTSRVCRIHAWDPDNTVNQFVLREGRLPENEHEVLAEGGTGIEPGIPIGTTVRFSRPQDDLDDYLEVEEAVVVGWVDTPLYLNMTKETSTLSNQDISTYLYIPSSAFTTDYYTEINILTTDGKSYDAFSTAYEDYIAPIKAKLEQLASTQQSVRRDRLYEEGLADYYDGLDSYLEAVQEFNTGIADGRQELLDAQQEIDDGWSELNDGIQELNDASASLEAGRASGQAEIDAGWDQYNEGLQEYEQGLEEFNQTKEELTAQQAEIQSSLEQLTAAQTALNSYDAGSITLGQLLNSLPETAEDSGTFTQAQLQALMTAYGLSEDNTLTDLQTALQNAQSATQTIRNTPVAGLLASVDTTYLSTEELTMVNDMLADNPELTVQDILDRAETDPDNAEVCYSLLQKFFTLIPITDTDGNTLQVADLVQLDQLTEAIDALLASPWEVLQVGQLTAGQEDLAALAAALNVSDEEPVSTLLSAIETQIATLEAADQQITDGLASGQAELDDAWAQLEDARYKLEAGQRELNLQIEQGKQEIEDGWAEIESSRQTLLDAQQEVDDGWQELADEEADGEQELADAKADLDKAAQDLADLEEGEWTVTDRTEHYASETFKGSVQQMASIASVFPLFFFLVAALVCLTTMTRMVDEQRGQLGIFRALGYTPSQCASRFMTYAAIASIVGEVAGVLLGMAVFPGVIYNAWKMMYVLPDMVFYLPWNLILAAGLGFLGVMLLTTWLTCRSEMKEVPAQLMRPKAPKVGRQILLEKIPAVWNHLSFDWKITIRNLVRYKKRFAMTVIGVAGCTALMITGFGIRSSVNNMIQWQFDRIQLYDGYAVMSEEQTTSQIADYAAALLERDDVEEVQICGSYQAKVQDDGETEEETATVQVFSSADDVQGYYSLQNRLSGEAITLTDDGVVMDEKLSELLGLEVGDTFLLESDSGVIREAKVAGICEFYVTHYVLMTQNCYESIFQVTKKMDTILLQCGDSDTSALQTELAADSAVEGISFFDALISNFDSMVSSLNLIVWVIILCSMLLAFTVLGNLTNINISERQREIATLKVLGFRRREVQNYIYKENNILTFLGSLLGIPMGIRLHHWIMAQVEMDYVMFGRTLDLPDYLIPIALTIGFGLLVNLFMNKKLRSITMVESLKSVE